MLDNSGEIMKSLKNLGVRIAIDNFGAGCCSLEDLNRLPIDSLKIDQSFVCDLEQSNENHATIKTIIVITYALGIEVVAGGVETVRQLETLTELGCDEIQGFLFSKVVSPVELDALPQGDGNIAIAASA